MSSYTLHPGDSLATLRTLPAASVHCVVTSPPYWGLRDYGVAGQIGLEPTPADYLARMVDVFREVHRVLRPDGTLWLNMGDSYATHPQGPSLANSTLQGSLAPHAQTRIAHGLRKKATPTGFKPKDLIGMPWRLAFALQDAGWYLRTDIIWHKPNPMPESVQDRPTKAHEYLFLLTKSERYYYDRIAIMEPCSGTSHPRGNGLNPKARIPSGWDTGPGNHQGLTGRYPGNGVGWNRSSALDPADDRNARPRVTTPRQNASFSAAVANLVTHRNARSVWTIPTQPYKQAHFATFPDRLAQRCILAGTSAHGCCPLCGAPWKRIVETKRAPRGDHFGAKDQSCADHGQSFREYQEVVSSETTGWAPTCPCGGALDPIPCTVADPFAGAGTTGLVALKLGRNAILCELSPDYCQLIHTRLQGAIQQ